MDKEWQAPTDSEVLCDLTQELIHDNEVLLKDIGNLKILLEIEADDKTHYIEIMKAKLKQILERLK